MKRQHDHTPTDQREILPRAYRRAIGWTSLIWFAVMATACLLWAILGSGHFARTGIQPGEAIAIGVASLLVSYASFAPEYLGRRRAPASPTIPEGSGIAQRQSGRLVAGVVIRLIGTVALFLTCRYHMATPMELVAAMTITWYVLLTSVDVAVLVCELPKGALFQVSKNRSHNSG